MSKAGEKLDAAIEDIKNLLDFLVEHTNADIETMAVEFDVDKELTHPTSSFSDSANVQQLREMHEESLIAEGITKNIPALVKECVKLVKKHPDITDNLAEILRRMHVEVR